MNKEIYQAMNRQIIPSAELIARTKAAVQLQQRQPLSHRLAPLRYVATAVCLLAIVLSAFALPKGSLTPTEPEPEQTSLSIVPASSPAPDSEALSDSDFQLDSGLMRSRFRVSAVSAVDVQKLDATKRALSEDEIYSAAELSLVVPTQFLDGFQFESASLQQNGGLPTLSVRYASGYRYIELRIHKYQAEDRQRLVDIDQPASYDITRYSIPFADSVPPALREKVDNPVFKAGELSEEILALRCYHSDDLGEDAASIRIRFSILCGDVVAEYTIKAASFDGVYPMVTSAACFL